MLAYAGIEAASDLAPDIDVRPRDLKRIVSVGALAVPLVYAGMAAIALMAVPVVAGPDGPETALGNEFVEAPVLGVVSAYEPAWVADAMRWIVAAGRRAGALLGGDDVDARRLPPHLHAGDQPPDPQLAGQARQPPRDAPGGDRDLGRDRDRPRRARRRQAARPASTPSARRWRSRSPTSRSCACGSPNRTARAPFACRWDVEWRGARLPVPALFAALLSGLAFLSVLAYHDTARWVGGGWMLFGLLFYVVYRKVFEGTTLTKRVSVTEKALTKQVPDVAYRNILVPVFGTELDDDIVATAGRLAAAEQEEAGDEDDPTRLDLVYVIEVPLTLPLDAELAPEIEAEAAPCAAPGKRRRRGVRRRAGQRRRCVRAREVGAGIVEAARRSGAEAIVIGGEPPTKIRGGATLGGIGAARPAEVGAATEYVLKKAPCRVLLTAPPEAPPEPAAEPAPRTRLRAW